MFNRASIDDNYERYVLEYLSSDAFNEALVKGTTWRSYFLDEIFMTMFTLKYNYRNIIKYVKMLYLKKERYDYEHIRVWLDKKAIIHNMFQYEKMNLFNELIERGIIK